jgi:hypothetical protein
MFIFVHNPADETSAGMMRLLQSVEAADYLAPFENCSLQDSPATRERLSAYGVESVPTFIAVKPDGSFRKHAGPITLDGLQELAESLAE